MTTHRRTGQRYSTKPEYMSSSRREHLKWSPPQVVDRAKKIGSNAAKLVDRLMSSKRQGLPAMPGDRSARWSVGARIVSTPRTSAPLHFLPTATRA